MKRLGCICIVFLLFSCSMTVVVPEKINGLSFVASGEAIGEENVRPVVEVNANYASIMPFGFIRDLQHPKVNYNWERQWFGETLKGVEQYISELRKAQIKIMLKPQIWISRGEYTGLIEMETQENWEILEKSYRDFILEFAQLANDLNIEIFCIGTELDRFIQGRPEYWSALIAEIKSVYQGQLTYAANWDEFKRVPFWNELDYIGIDAYFPLSDARTPTVEDCREGWQMHKSTIVEISKEHNRAVLFTEFGYRSVDYSAKEPWNSDRRMNTVNLTAQTNAMTALFEEFWDEPWFAGGFIWKWFHDSSRINANEHSLFSPQNKPVQDVIRDTYLHY